jgi:hypothetical protein
MLVMIESLLRLLDIEWLSISFWKDSVLVVPVPSGMGSPGRESVVVGRVVSGAIVVRLMPEACRIVADALNVVGSYQQAGSGGTRFRQGARFSIMGRLTFQLVRLHEMNRSVMLQFQDVFRVFGCYFRVWGFRRCFFGGC